MLTGDFKVSPAHTKAGFYSNREAAPVLTVHSKLHRRQKCVLSAVEDFTERGFLTITRPKTFSFFNRWIFKLRFCFTAWFKCSMFSDWHFFTSGLTYCMLFVMFRCRKVCWFRSSFMINFGALSEQFQCRFRASFYVSTKEFCIISSVIAPFWPNFYSLNSWTVWTTWIIEDWTFF